MSRNSVVRSGAKAAAIVVVSLVVAGPAIAQDAPADPVIAIVDGEPITEADLRLAAQDLGGALEQLPPEQRMSGLINGLIDIRLMARAAEAADLDEDAEAQRRLGFVRDRALRAEYLRVNVFEAITDEKVQEIYDAQVAAFVPEEEIRASHILVETEAEAVALIAELDGGADFAQLAKDSSIDLGSGANGGDLDFFGRGRMIPPFEEAAFALEPGAYTKTPVQSDFGWHIILAVDQRMSSPPTMEDLGPGLREAAARDLFLAALEELRAAAEIEIIEPEGEPAGEAEADGDAPAAPQ
jgi:peptidyl-prolyl cis-trans isomerase C